MRAGTLSTVMTRREQGTAARPQSPFSHLASTGAPADQESCQQGLQSREQHLSPAPTRTPSTWGIWGPGSGSRHTATSTHKTFDVWQKRLMLHWDLSSKNISSFPVTGSSLDPLRVAGQNLGFKPMWFTTLGLFKCNKASCPSSNLGALPSYSGCSKKQRTDNRVAVEEKAPEQILNLPTSAFEYGSSTHNS